MALIWIGVMFDPTVPVADGAATSAGVELMTGAELGLMRIVTDAALPVPTTLLAFNTTAKSPLWVGAPVIRPVLALSDKPDGRPVAL